MSWSPPRTWTADEVVTAEMFNAHLRDNLAVLAVTRDSSGRISALNSSTFADLSAANLTGLADPSGGNSFTAGRHRFIGSSVFKVPVGADKWAGTKGSDARGIWVEGDYLHHIGSNHTTEWRYLGTYVGAVGVAYAGCVWVEVNDLHYIDADGDERKCISSGATGAHSDTGALAGSGWIETYIHWIRGAGTLEKPGHADVAHADHTDHGDHTDHQDNGTHQDHDDHDDEGSGHSDFTDYTDHYDSPVYVDGENSPHQDYDDYLDYDDHDDTGPHYDYNDHSDSNPHSDVAADNRPVTV